MSIEIVSVEDIKNHLNITGDADDTLLRLKLDVAQELVENFTGRKFAEWYDDASEVYSVPAPLLEAVRQMAAGLYENREGQQLPVSAYALLAPYRTWSM